MTPAPPTEYRDLLRHATARNDARMAQSATARAVSGTQAFALDLASGTVVFDLPGGSETCNVQIAGTVAADGEFMWAWGHPSVPEPLQTAAWGVKNYAEAHGLPDLLDRKVHVTPKRAADFAALTALFADATGTFCGNYGSGEVWLAYFTGPTT